MPWNPGRWLAPVLWVLPLGCVHLGTQTVPPTPAPVGEATAPLPAATQAQLHWQMAESLDQAGQTAGAIRFYEQARATDSSYADRAARRLAVLYDQVDEQAKALVEFTALVQKHPKDADLLNNLGYSYYNRGDWANAEIYLRKAVAVNAKHARAWINLGLTLAQQDKTADALTAFTKAVSPAEAHANLAFVFTTQGKLVQAKAAYQQALALEPTLPVARTALARLEQPKSADAPKSATP
jgi:Tfp pilus assembly protein PilF